MRNVTFDTNLQTGTSVSDILRTNIWICFFVSFIIGGIAACIAKTISAPFERVKLIQQCLYNKKIEINLLDREAQESYKETSTFSLGIFECLRFIYKTQGFVSLWRGNIANCLRYVPKFALDMALKPQFFILYLSIFNPMDNKFLLFATKWFAGASAAIISTIVCYPLDFARTRLATDISRNTRFDGIWDCWKKILRHDGFLSIYKGLGVCLIGEVIYRGFKYGLYDTFNDMGSDHFNFHGASLFIYNWLIGWAAAALASSIAMPFDTVKRVLMTDTYGPTEQYRNMINCWISLVKEDGFIRLWRGSVSNLIRSWSSGLALAGFTFLEDIAFNHDTLLSCKNH